MNGLRPGPVLEEVPRPERSAHRPKGTAGRDSGLWGCREPTLGTALGRLGPKPCGAPAADGKVLTEWRADMDLNYLYYRHQVEQVHAGKSACPEAMAAHGFLANAYARLIDRERTAAGCTTHLPEQTPYPACARGDACRLG